MLNSVKAITYGIISIIILGLCNQLLLIMGLVGYASLAKSYPLLSEYTQIFTYTLGGSGYFVVMFFGGLISTMTVIKSDSINTPLRKSYIITVIASIIGSTLSLYMSLKDEIFTLIALFFLLFGIIAALTGCHFWLAYTAKNQGQSEETATP